MPPKKAGGNSKAEAARERKEKTTVDKKEKEEKEKEEAYWKEAEGSKSKAAKKKEEDEARKAEAAAKRAEAKKLADAEAAELEKGAKAKEKVGGGSKKITAAELQRQKEQEQKRLEAAAAENKSKARRMTDEDAYDRMVAVENTNRVEVLVDARSVSEALTQLTVTGGAEAPVDKHPERRLKASHKAFEEAEIARLKEEKPGLAMQQYKDLAWKAWRKSPLNPINQAAASGGAAGED